MNINYEFTTNSYQAKKWLDGLPDLIATDFEVAGKFTEEQRKFMKNKLDHYRLPFEERRELLQQYKADGLSYPSLTVITHLSVAWSDHDAYVFVCDGQNLRSLVLNFLVTTERLQLWHNSCFDLKLVKYWTGKMPKHFVDTQLLAKCFLNDADQYKGETGLKALMAYEYGEWAKVKDSTFVLEDMYNADMIKYSATDACATFRLYKDILSDIEESC